MFVHLNAKTRLSVCEGTLLASELATLGTAGVADSCWSGIFDIHDAFLKGGGKALFGFDATVHNVVYPSLPEQRLRLYAMDERGFYDLMSLTSLQELHDGVLRWDQIEERAQRLLVITGSLSSEIGYALYRGLPIVDFYHNRFGDRLYLEAES